MDCEKVVDIVAEFGSEYIATIWTGTNYYIDCFSKESIASQIACASENGIGLSVQDAIRSCSVSTMSFMCRNEDFTAELLEEWIKHLTSASAQKSCGFELNDEMEC